MSARNGMKLYSNVEWEQSVGYMKVHLEALKGQEIYSLIDIGAAHGHFAMMWEDVFNSDMITLVEANSLSCEEMDYLPWTIVNKAVGKPGKATFYTNPTERTGGGSSLYLENTEWFENANEEEMEVFSLDDLDIRADMIKIDVQGAEYDVIKYGEDTIKDAKFLVLELSFMEYNEGAPLIDDVLTLTRKLGFRMIDTLGPNKGGHWYKHRKNQVDVILAREDQPVFVV